jgi:hypothetical protein
MPKVEYCGREISELGLSISEKKCQTINNFPEPKLAQGLKSFLGMVNYFRDFVQNHSDIIRPLQNLFLNIRDRTLSSGPKKPDWLSLPLNP